MTQLDFSCGCGATKFSASEPALFRIICHCSICKKFQQADCADISVFSHASVSLPEDGVVQFQTYRPPPNVQRGRCASCDQPAVEVFEGPLMPSLVMVPAEMFTDPEQPPEPSAHIFCEGAVAPISDKLRQHRGYIASQLGFFRCYLAGIRHARKTA